MMLTLDLGRLGERLRQARSAAALTQKDLGIRVGAAASWISDLEKGKQKGLAAETVYRLAQALDCSSDYLLGLSDDPTPARRRRKKPAAPAEADEEAVA